MERFPCPQDARATNVRLTPAGWDKVRHTAPGHVANVRQHVIDALTREQVRQLASIAEAPVLLHSLTRKAPVERSTGRRNSTAAGLSRAPPGYRHGVAVGAQTRGAMARSGSLAALEAARRTEVGGGRARAAARPGGRAGCVSPATPSWTPGAARARRASACGRATWRGSR